MVEFFAFLIYIVPYGTDRLLNHDPMHIETDPSARRQRSELEKELAELAEFPEMNPGPVIRLNRDAIIVLANRAARILFRDDHLLDKNWLQLCPGMNTALWEQVLESTTPVTCESEIDGRVVMYTFVRPASGDSVFAYGTDITELRKAEKLLAEKAAQLAEIARFPEMNPGPVVRTDLEGDILLANAAARNVFGDNLPGTCWRDIIDGLGDEIWTRILNAEGPVPVEARVDERDFIFHHRRDVNGQLVFVFGADITLQKRAESILRQSEKLATLGTLAAGIAHELNNPAAATRRAAEQLREASRKLAEAQFALNKTNLPEEGQTILESLLNRISERPGVTSVRNRFDLETAIENWLDEHNIPDSWELAPSLAQQGIDPAALNEIAGTVGNTSLAVILTWAAHVSTVYMLLYDIGLGSSRVSEIVNALRNYTYLGQAPLQSVDIHEGIENTLVILRHKLKEGIRVNRDFATGLPKITAYGSELNQVWTNLIHNAAEALDGRGEIAIRTQHNGEWVVVRVEDNGPGIPEENLTRIFDPFFTTKPPGKGTGLGLSTSYSIVTDRHKGSITVESRPGYTCFIVRLPVSLSPDRDPTAFLSSSFDDSHKTQD
jgi:signal transduction histidine kinase